MTSVLLCSSNVVARSTPLAFERRFPAASSASNRSYDEQRFLARDHRIRQRRVNGFMRKIFFAGKKP
jgi:hypothetical protein